LTFEFLGGYTPDGSGWQSPVRVAVAVLTENRAVLEESSRLLLAKVEIEQGVYTAAITDLERVSQQAPKSAETAYLLGVAHEKEGNHEQALECYRRSYTLDGKNISAVMAITEVLVTQGKIAEAQDYLDNHMNQAGDEPGMYELAGRLAMMRKEYERAAGFYQQARDLDFKNGLYQEALAVAQFHAGKYAEAADTLKNLLAIKDRKPALWMHQMLGDCSMATNRLYDARAQYQLATEIEPGNPDLWVRLATSTLKIGDNPRTILAAKQALALDPKNADAAIVMSYAMIRDGQAARAVDVLKQAISVNEKNPQLHCLLGKAYAASGHEDQAVKCYATAVQIDPNDRAAKELHRLASVQKISIVN